MNTTEQQRIREVIDHTDRLVSIIKKLWEVDQQKENIRTMEYYDVFSSEAERKKDLASLDDLYGRLNDSLSRELNIGSML